MVVTVRDVLDDDLFSTALPCVEVASGDLDAAVRWVFTNEREDVASFLTGGELLVVEGRSLVADGRGSRLDDYAKSLVEAGIAALVVELVEGVVALPDCLAQAARREGLTVIGLHHRIPFVDICQHVNTMIVRGQMRMQMQMDVMSTSLRAELARAGDVQAVAEVIARLFDENVAIFDMDGLQVARVGPHTKDDLSANAVLALSDQARPFGALEISQHNTTFDKPMRRKISQIVSPVLALYLDGGARVGMIAHLVSGPADRVHVTSVEAHDGHAMLDALGFAAASVYMPFGMRLKSVSDAMPAISAMIETFESREGCESLCLLEGDLLIGFFAAKDSGGDVVRFSEHCLNALRETVANGCIYALHGHVALDTISLMDAFGALRAMLNVREDDDGGYPYGSLVCTDATLLKRMLDVERTDDAVRMIVTQTVGYELLRNSALIDTLCACFDNLDNKTGACEQLGIQRQTLYNRLDKVTQIVGISPSNKISWSMLLLGAKLVQSQRKHSPMAMVELK